MSVPISSFLLFVLFFFFNDTATTEIYTLSLHDALPILRQLQGEQRGKAFPHQALVHADGVAVLQIAFGQALGIAPVKADRKSTRLNSSHSQISYAVFCLKKKKKNKATETQQRPRQFISV